MTLDLALVQPETHAAFMVALNAELWLHIDACPICHERGICGYASALVKIIELDRRFTLVVERVAEPMRVAA